MDRMLTALHSLKKMPLPMEPHVTDYGAEILGKPHEVFLFPAILRSMEVDRPEPIAAEGESSCYFHPKIAATAICEISGRFICDLCKTEWEGRTVSFDALQLELGAGSGKRKKKARTRWDNIALSLVTIPLLVWPTTLLTAPAAFLICLFKFNSAGDHPVGSSKLKFLITAIIALLIMVGWGYIFYSIFREGGGE